MMAASQENDEQQEQTGAPVRGWGWLKQVQNTTQQFGQICTEGVGQARRRLEENRPGIDQFVKNIGDNVQQGMKKVQETQPGLDQLVRNIGGNIQKEFESFQENLARDPWSSPPTSAEMAGLDLVYVNKSIIAMGFPVDKRPPPPPAEPSEGIRENTSREVGAGRGRRQPQATPPIVQNANDIDVVAAVLRSRHAGHYMVWNVSEEGYDYAMFEDNVLEFRFPGHPAPPLGMLFKICTSVESWLGADSENIAAVHCLTGRGRTSTVLACYLAWVGDFSTPLEALQHVATCKKIPMERLTIPSQRRYLSYFSSVMEGVRPRSEPLLLRRVIMNTIPTFGTKGGKTIGPGGGASAVAAAEEAAARGEGTEGEALGCCPYIQVFKSGALIFTATYRPAEGLATAAASETGGSSEAGQASTEGGAGVGGTTLPWAYTSDDSIAFPVDCVLQGDLLIRCRHLSPNGRRVSMFRAAFHTGYVPCGVLRLTKQQLDGACADDRFHQDFFLDLIFAPVENKSSANVEEDVEEEPKTPPSPDAAGTGEASTEASAEKGGDAGDGGEVSNVEKEDEEDKKEAENAAAARREGGLVVDSAAGEAFDSMLHRDARFWTEIAARKERRSVLLKKRAEARARGQIPTNMPEANKNVGGASSGGMRFSIDEEEAAQSGRTPSTDANASVTGKPQPSAGGITDEDLLAQLAEAELDQDDFLGGGNPGDDGLNVPGLPKIGPGEPVVSDSDFSPAVPQSGTAADGLVPEETVEFDLPDLGVSEGQGGKGDVVEGQGSDHKQAVSSSTMSTAKVPSAQKGSTPKTSQGGLSATKGNKAVESASGSLQDELSQLEELERELGIMGVGGEGAAGGGGGENAGGVKVKGVRVEVEASKDDAFDMDNLDELEGYLESLAK